MTGVVGGLADHEHGERHLVRGVDGFVVQHPGTVADAFDRDRRRPLHQLPRLRLLTVLGIAAAVGATTAVAGAIGFVGLVVPHLLRPVFGHRPSALLLPSALGGAGYPSDW